METIKEKLKKIQALATHGVDGEAENASKLLRSLLKKHSLTIDDLRCDTAKEYSFKYNTVDERLLFVHIVMRVCGSKSDARNSATYSRTRKLMFANLTEIQYIDVVSMLDFHRKQLKKEKAKILDELTGAYVNKHRLFGGDHENKDSDDEIDFEALERSLALQKQLANVSYHKIIEQ